MSSDSLRPGAVEAIEMAPPQPGEIVRVRQRQYLVEQVVPPAAAGDATLVRLSCLDDDAQGQELGVLWEAELDAEILSGTGWEHLATRGFDPPAALLGLPAHAALELCHRHQPASVPGPLPCRHPH